MARMNAFERGSDEAGLQARQDLGVPLHRHAVLGVLRIQPAERLLGQRSRERTELDRGR
jgi:hypothetical protein